jgi:hypothetical protein
MKCVECNQELETDEHQNSLDHLGVALCVPHIGRIVKLKEINDTPTEAVLLYYELKKAGISPMLEWWDGKKSVDIAISRVKLNIEIDTEYEMLTHEQAINDLEDTMHSFKNGFTTIRIPHILIKHYLEETVRNIMGIMEGLKANIKTL